VVVGDLADRVVMVVIQLHLDQVSIFKEMEAEAVEVYLPVQETVVVVVGVGLVLVVTLGEVVELETKGNLVVDQLVLAKYIVADYIYGMDIQVEVVVEDIPKLVNKVMVIRPVNHIEVGEVELEPILSL
jgi:hypothetical protein